MKNLYIMAFLFLTGSFYSQDLQNANWTIGNFGGLEFNGITSPITSAMTTAPSMSSASVSDQEGNLLFYTNGETVWNKNHQIMTNGTGLLGRGGDMSQKAVIIPNPLDINRFYIVTISSNLEVGQQHGLLFSEVDMSNGLGQVLNPKNTPLPDFLGNLIDDSYPINYGKITTAKHDNGLDYWLIANIDQDIFVYLVDHTGIVCTRSEASPLPPTLVVDSFGQICSSDGPMKMSLQDDKILIGFSSTLDAPNPNPRGRLYIGVFDNANGDIDGFFELDQNNGIEDIYLTGAEFSASGNVVHRFYEADGVSGEVISSTVIVGHDGIRYIWTVSDEVITPIPWGRNLQRGIDGLIYFENDDLSSGNPNFLGVILSPEQSPYQVTFNQIDVNNATGFAKNIPPWVQWQPCHRFLTTTEQITSSRNRSREEWITASNEIVNSTTRVIYHAGRYVDLTPGFEATDGSQFAAYIEGCSNSFVYRDQNSSHMIGSNPKPDLSKKSNSFAIVPNPSSSLINVVLNNFSSWKLQIVSLDGRKVFETSIQNSDKIQVDVSSYNNGIYIVTVTDVSGQQFSQKLIKN